MSQVRNQILVSGNNHTLLSGVTLVDKLEKGVYAIKYVPMEGFSLDYIDKEFNVAHFKVDEKREKSMRRWTKAWNNCDTNMGILLTGLKGAGKTLLAKKFASSFDCPVLILNHPYTDEIDMFRSFLTNPLLQGAIIIVDEFEKTFAQSGKDDDVSPMLSIFDDGLNTRLLWIFISNSMQISEFMLNRPGRVRYIERFESMGRDEVRKALTELLEKQENIDEIEEVLMQFDELSYDIVSKFAKEVNLFPDEDPNELLKIMNIANNTSYYRATANLSIIILNGDSATIQTRFDADSRVVSLSMCSMTTNEESCWANITLDTDAVHKYLCKAALLVPDMEKITPDTARQLDAWAFRAEKQNAILKDGNLLFPTITGSEDVWVNSVKNSDSYYIIRFMYTEVALVRTKREELSNKAL